MAPSSPTPTAALDANSVYARLFAEAKSKQHGQQGQQGRQGGQGPPRSPRLSLGGGGFAGGGGSKPGSPRVGDRLRLFCVSYYHSYSYGNGRQNILHLPPTYRGSPFSSRRR